MPVGQDMVLRGISDDRLSNRKRLLLTLDQRKRDIDASNMVDAMDAKQRQALEILTSNKLTKALDLSKEDPKVLERYGKGDPKRQMIAASFKPDTLCRPWVDTKSQPRS